MLRILFDKEYRRGWLKFKFNPFWYGILGMPFGSGYVDHTSQTNYDY